MKYRASITSVNKDEGVEDGANTCTSLTSSSLPKTMKCLQSFQKSHSNERKEDSSLSSFPIATLRVGKSYVNVMIDFCSEVSLITNRAVNKLQLRVTKR